MQPDLLLGEGTGQSRQNKMCFFQTMTSKSYRIPSASTETFIGVKVTSLQSLAVLFKFLHQDNALRGVLDTSDRFCHARESSRRKVKKE